MRRIVPPHGSGCTLIGMTGSRHVRMRATWKDCLVRRAMQTNDEREAMDACGLLCQRALQVIRASAFRKEPVDAPGIFHGDYAEWIRLVADACDGLARPRPSAAEALAYRRQTWEPVQHAWVTSVLLAAS
jgi:hypothetical protein